ncbi:MAG: hypothetical protein DIU60_019790 [Actinomycetes bacterium]|jgi:hypothetical protein|nr:MAG: hypothetical protein DIU60_18730 [Actinomycetota bacterium]
MSVLSDDNSPFTHYEALERRCRGIIRHLVLSVAAGAAAGVIGTLIHLSGIRQVELAYDPYAYFALAVLVGRTAAGLGWAALSATLAALAPLIPALAGIGLAGHARDALGGDPDSLNILLLVLVGFGLVGYAARGPGLGADVAAGAAAGVLLADVGGRAVPGLPGVIPAFLPWPALAVTLLLLVLVLALRRTPWSRLRALAVAVLIAGGYLLVLGLAG